MGEKQWGVPSIIWPYAEKLIEQLENAFTEIYKISSVDVKVEAGVDYRRTDLFPKNFRPSNMKQYRKISGVRYRLPRKAKKAYKKRMCKQGELNIKKLKFSYRRLNSDLLLIV